MSILQATIEQTLTLYFGVIVFLTAIVQTKNEWGKHALEDNVTKLLLILMAVGCVEAIGATLGFLVITEAPNGRYPRRARRPDLNRYPAGGPNRIRSRHLLDHLGRRDGHRGQPLRPRLAGRQDDYHPAGAVDRRLDVVEGAFGGVDAPNAQIG